MAKEGDTDLKTDLGDEYTTLERVSRQPRAARAPLAQASARFPAAARFPLPLGPLLLVACVVRGAS